MTMPLYEGGRDLFADPAGRADRRATAQPGRRRAPRSGADRDPGWETLQAARAASPRSRRRCGRRRSPWKGTQQEALVGSRTVLDVLIAEQQLFTTQSQLVGAQHDAALAEFNLAAAIGRLIAPELQAAGQALRHGAPLQGGEGQMVRLRRRAEGVARPRRQLPLANPADCLACGSAANTGARCRINPAARTDDLRNSSAEAVRWRQIIASISRIIAEDDAHRSPRGHSAATGGVLELTEALNDDGSVRQVGAAAPSRRRRRRVTGRRIGRRRAGSRHAPERAAARGATPGRRGR